jgi:hypothetical protein
VTVQEPEDGILDVLAAVQAHRDRRTADLDLILRHGDAADMLAAAVKLLAEAADEGNAPPGHFRAWGMQAWGRRRLPGHER